MISYYIEEKVLRVYMGETVRLDSHGPQRIEGIIDCEDSHSCLIHDYCDKKNIQFSTRVHCPKELCQDKKLCYVITDAPTYIMKSVVCATDYYDDLVLDYSMKREDLSRTKNTTEVGLSSGKILQLELPFTQLNTRKIVGEFLTSQTCLRRDCKIMTCCNRTLLVLKSLKNGRIVKVCPVYYNDGYWKAAICSSPQLIIEYVI